MLECLEPHLFPACVSSYEHTRLGSPGSGTRNWRKNRNNSTETEEENCGEPEVTSSFGVDLNRNFGFKWNGAKSNAKKCPKRIAIPCFIAFLVTAGIGDVCSEVYPGPKGFSEPESRNIREINLHSQSSLAMRFNMSSCRDFYLSLDPLPEMALAVHSFQQSICKKGRNKK